MGRFVESLRVGICVHNGDFNMKIKHRSLVIAFVFLVITFFAPSANAVSASGTIAVTATTAASVSLTFVSDGAGITLGGSGTSAATISFGAVQAYGGSVPSGVTKTVNGTTDWSLSTPIDVV